MAKGRSTEDNPNETPRPCQALAFVATPLVDGDPVAVDLDETVPAEDVVFDELRFRAGVLLSEATLIFVAVIADDTETGDEHHCCQNDGSEDLFVAHKSPWLMSFMESR